MPDEELEKLLNDNRELLDSFDEVATQQRKEKNGQLKVLFTIIHRNVTKEIVRAVGVNAFDKPKALLKLNTHFARAYIRAARNPASDPKWKKAFETCELEAQSADQIGSDTLTVSPSFPLVNEALAQQNCTEAEGNVHINQDIVEALKATSENGKCTVTTRDFGNVLDLVQRASKDGLIETQPTFIGRFEALVKDYLLPDVAETWRNAAYKKVCGDDVKKPEREFRQLMDQAPAAAK
jgi:hypothetical protein